MTTLPLHPAAVHVPLALAVLLPLVAIGALVWALRRGPGRTGVAVLVALQAALLASGFVAARLGERDEDRVERFAGEAAIESHEERAELFLWSSGVVLVVAAGVLAAPRRVRVAGLAAVAACTVVVAALAIRTGEAGGELVYARGGAAAWQADGPPPVPAVASDHDDD